MKSKELLIIGLVWPEPHATAAGVRMLQLINVFIEAGYTITFVSSASTTENSKDLTMMGVTTRKIELNNSSFDEFLIELRPDIVLFDRFLTEEQFGWRVVEQCPNALRILDTEDLHSLRHVRENCVKRNVPFSLEIWMQEDKTKREVASILRCDLSLIISSYEMKLLKEVLELNPSLLLHLPFMHEAFSVNTLDGNFEDRRDFIFIGGGKHQPNLDAILYLKKEIWPRLYQQLPHSKCHIFGAYLPQAILELHAPENGFCVHGKAEKVSEIMKNARVCLAPLRFGAGIKGKLMDAMVYGTPSITTEIGAEGMCGELEWNGFVTNNPDDFIQKSVTLYQDKMVWKKAQQNGVEIVNRYFNKDHLKDSLLKRLNDLNLNLEQHRLTNFYGSLLQHQTLRSTKYMSKWIEEKNKHS